jgi:hypothetical protein
MRKTGSKIVIDPSSRERLPGREEVRDEPPIRLPASAAELRGFTDWAMSSARPPRAHVSYLAGKIYIEVEPGGDMVPAVETVPSECGNFPNEADGINQTAAARESRSVFSA